MVSEGSGFWGFRVFWGGLRVRGIGREGLGIEAFRVSGGCRVLGLRVYGIRVQASGFSP